VGFAVRSIISIGARVARPEMIALAVGLYGGSAVAMTPPKLLPHAAGYTITVDVDSGLGAISGGRGALKLEWQRDCEGVSYSQHSVLALNYSDGTSADSEVRIASWEAADASRFRFLMESGTDGQTTESVDGIAKRQSDGSLRVTYSEPERTQTELPPGVVFPWQQMRRLLSKAAAGKTQDWHSLLRGEAEGDPSDVSVRILPMKSPLPTGLGDHGALLPKVGWQFVSAYFEEPAEPMPSFEITETVLASGVITQADITYPDFTMHIRLAKLSALPLPVCSAK
jgi:hypothetical protein